MTMTNSIYTCHKCHEEVSENRTPCKNCGSTLRDISMTFQDTITVKDSIDLKKYKEGVKRFLFHLKKGWFPSRNQAYSEGVDLTQLVDRENNLYVKKVVDLKNNAVLKNLEEPLSNHKQNKHET